MTPTKVTLGSVCDVLNGFAFKSDEYVSSGIRVIRITNVQKGQIEDDDPKFIATERAEEFSRFLLSEGDLLVSMTGNVGRVGVLPKIMLPAALNQRVGALKVKPQKIDQRYLFQLLNSDSFERDAIANSKGVAQLNLSSKWIEGYEVPLPPLAEQKRIAAILDAADALRAKRREALAQLDTLLQAAFLDFFGDPISNPRGWKVLNGDEVFEDLTYGTSAKCSDVQGGDMLPVLRIPNIVGGQISLQDMKFAKLPPREVANLRLKRDDLLFVRTNGNPDYIGRCARFEGRFESLYASYLIRARLKETSGLKAEFLKQQIGLPAYRREVRKEARTTAGNYNLSTVGIRNFRFIIPPLELQQRYTETVEAVASHKSRLEGHLAELDNLFASLQSRAFGGECNAR